jgi:transposase
MELKREQLEQLNKAQLVEVIIGLQGIIAQQGARIQALEDQLAKNSGNSGKPPSSDGLKKPRTQSLRKKGNRASGGQAGHEGHQLEMTARPDEIITHRVACCPQCATRLEGVAVAGIEKRQVVDVPVPRVQVVEHQAEIKQCPGCGQVVKAAFPAGVKAQVQYGPNLQSHMVYLHEYQLLPLARTAEVLEAVYGHRPSQAAVLTASQRLEQQIEGEMVPIRQALSQSPCLHGDESGIRAEGSLRWVHVVSTDEWTLYSLHDKRGFEGMSASGILPNFRGWVVHDGLEWYQQFTDCQHALCNAHHLRELRFIVEQYQQAWAEDLFKLLVDMKQQVDHGPVSPEAQQQAEAEYTRLLQLGYDTNPEVLPTGKRGRKRRSPPQNLLRRLSDHRHQVLAFWRHPGVPFDNNQAERDLRMMKVRQKISGTFRSLEHAHLFCNLRSWLSTLRKQGIAIFDALCSAFAQRPVLLPTP